LTRRERQLEKYKCRLSRPIGFGSELPRALFSRVCLPRLRLAIFSLSQLRLQLEADGGNAGAARVLELRRHSNQVLVTVIWGNIATNVLLTLLSDAVLAGLSAFFFLAFVIAMLSEIFPQAYFSRNALQMATRFSPFLNFY
jgi:metal transporter CNNM